MSAGNISSYSPVAFLRSARTHRSLILRLTSRKIEARYRGSLLGVAWGILNPLLMLAVYTFVFTFVLRARWEATGRGEVALLVFSGLVLYSVFSKCVNEAPTLVLSSRAYVEQLVFPTEILVWVSVLAALFDFVVATGVLALGHLLVLGAPQLSWLLIPIVALPVVLLSLGATWFLSSLGVFLRDIEHLVGVFTTALLFLSPVLYPASMISEILGPVAFLNPFTSLVGMFRQVIFSGTAPDWLQWSGVMLASWLVAWFGYWWFMKTKKSMADVL